MRLIIFDMDGTLVDTVGLIVATVGDAFTALGETAPDEQAVRAISGITLDQAIAILAPHADEKRVGELSKSYREHYHPRAGRRRASRCSRARSRRIDRLRAKPGTHPRDRHRQGLPRRARAPRSRTASAATSTRCRRPTTTAESPIRR